MAQYYSIHCFWSLFLFVMPKYHFVFKLRNDGCSILLLLGMIYCSDFQLFLPGTGHMIVLQNCHYRIYSCISRPFMTKKSVQKIVLDLYTSHTQRPDQAVREISITTAGSALGKPVIIVVDFDQFSAHSSSTKECEIIKC